MFNLVYCAHEQIKYEHVSWGILKKKDQLKECIRIRALMIEGHVR